MVNQNNTTSKVSQVSVISLKRSHIAWLIVVAGYFFQMVSKILDISVFNSIDGIILIILFLPAHASEQGNVIRLVSVYMSSSFFVIERTRDLTYLKFVATNFSLKITSPSTGENSGDSA